MRFLASKVFDFLEKRDGCLIDRHELNDAAFGTVRRSLRQIVFELHDSGDPQAREISDQLRVLLSEWLTVPVPFYAFLRGAVTDVLGEADGLQARWGRDIRQLYDVARRAAENLASLESPMRDELRAVIREQRSNNIGFRIYCHRRARAHFESLLDPAVEPKIGEGLFMHSVRDYRESEPFDALIKVGPLRTRGWGSAPDALITAPRFGKLVQVVWVSTDIRN